MMQLQINVIAMEGFVALTCGAVRFWQGVVLNDSPG